MPAKFNTRKIYLEGATTKFNTRETQKFCGFLEPRNLVPAKFSTFKVLKKLAKIGGYVVSAFNPKTLTLNPNK